MLRLQIYIELVPNYVTSVLLRADGPDVQRYSPEISASLAKIRIFEL